MYFILMVWINNISDISKIMVLKLWVMVIVSGIVNIILLIFRLICMVSSLSMVSVKLWKNMLCVCSRMWFISSSFSIVISSVLK